MKYGINLKFETIVQIFRKIIQRIIQGYCYKAFILLGGDFEKHKRMSSKIYPKKWPQNGPLSCYVFVCSASARKFLSFKSTHPLIFSLKQQLLRTFTSKFIAFSMNLIK